MKFFESTQSLGLLVAWSVWGWHVGVRGYDWLGVVGGILGVMVSVPLMAVAPFVAWFSMGLPQAVWFYSSLGVSLACFALQFLLRRRIYDESGREIG